MAPPSFRLFNRSSLALLLVFLASACTGDKPNIAPPSLPTAMALTAVPFTSLPKWETLPTESGLRAFRRSCGVFRRRADDQDWIGLGLQGGTLADWKELCDELDRAIPPVRPFDAPAFQAFLEGRLQPYLVSDVEKGPQGLFTGYYESELKGCLAPTPQCRVPLYGLPSSLIAVDMGARYADMQGVVLTGQIDGDRIKPLPPRAEIESGVLDAEAPIIAWVDDPVEAHILHIQGSGRLLLPNGQTIRIGYAGNNGYPFKGLGRILLDGGHIPPHRASMPDVRAWLQKNPQQAESLMQKNQRFIFFRILDGEGPIGAMGVPLEAGHSLAVDPLYIPLGLPLWLSVNGPDGESLSGLALAQDIGAAVKGVVRGDLFWGSGEEAFRKAGRMKNKGSYYVLLPRKRHQDNQPLLPSGS